MALAIIVVVGLPGALPTKYRENPPWVAPDVVLALLAALIIGAEPHRPPGNLAAGHHRDRHRPGDRQTPFAARLVGDILTSNKLFAGTATGLLLATGGVIWATNVIAFGLWYWDLDRGGAATPAHHPQANPAFVFPKMQYADYAPAGWMPKFAGYLSLSLWTDTAFRPTDVSAIRRSAKLLMMTEAAVSLGTCALVIARAINILKYGHPATNPAGAYAAVRSARHPARAWQLTERACVPAGSPVTGPPRLDDLLASDPVMRGALWRA